MRRVEIDKGNESAVGGDSRVKCVKAVGGRTSIHANDHHPRYRSSDITTRDTEAPMSPTTIIRSWYLPISWTSETSGGSFTSLCRSLLLIESTRPSLSFLD